MKKTFNEGRHEAQRLRPGDDITAYLLKSKIFLDNGKFEKSIRILSEILEIEPKNKEAVNRMAINYKNLEMWDKAITWYNKLLLITPDKKEAITKDIIDCHIKNNNLEEAQKILTPLYEEIPDDYFVAWLQANIWLKSGKRENAYIELHKAKTLLEKEIKLNDKNDVALEILSMIYCLFFDFVNARKYIEMACDIKKSKARFRKWIEIFNLYKHQEGFPKIFINYHEIIAKEGRRLFRELLSELKKEIEDYKKIDPEHLAVQYQLMNLYNCTASLYLHVERYEEALVEMEKAQSIFPIDLHYLPCKVILLCKNKRYKEALSCIEYGKKTEYCAQYHEEWENIKEQILSEHPELNEQAEYT